MLYVSKKRYKIKLLIGPIDINYTVDSKEQKANPHGRQFGQGKNGYRLNCIRAKLKKTSDSWTNCIFLVMNLVVLVKNLAIQ